MGLTPNKLFDEFWSWRLEKTPEFATFTGEKKYNHLLERWTEARFEEDNKTCKDFLEKANTLQTNATDSNDKQNLEFLISELTIFVDGHQHGGYYFPLNYMEGAHVDFQRLAEWAAPATVKDYQDIVERYKLFQEQISEVIETMRSGVSKKMTSNAVSLQGVVDNCRKIANSDAESLDFYQPFQNIKCGTEEEIKLLQKNAIEAIDSSIKVGFSKLTEFLDKEYLPACRPEIAATSLPNGQEFYKACLKFHTTTDLAAEDIHKMGHEEVNRIEN